MIPENSDSDNVQELLCVPEEVRDMLKPGTILNVTINENNGKTICQYEAEFLGIGKRGEVLLKKKDLGTTR